jgi:hypothetical protein
MQSFNRRLALVFVVSYAVVQGGQAHGGPLISVTAAPGAVSVLEGDFADVRFTITNLSNQDLYINNTTPLTFINPDGSMAQAFYLRGDRDDMIMGQAVSNTPPINTLLLANGGTNFFDDRIFTIDLKVKGDTDVGVWSVAVGVLVLFSPDDTQPADVENGFVTVEVRDPNAITTLPEPSSFLLLGLGSLSLGGFAVVRAHRSGRLVARLP